MILVSLGIMEAVNNPSPVFERLTTNSLVGFAIYLQYEELQSGLLDRILHDKTLILSIEVPKQVKNKHQFILKVQSSTTPALIEDSLV